MKSFRVLSVVVAKGFLRDKASVFFSFLFPLLFLVIVGLIFGGEGSSRTEIAAVGDGPVISSLANSDDIEVRRADSLETASRQVRSGDLAAVVVEEGNRVVLHSPATGTEQAGAARGLVSAAVAEQNLAATGQPSLITMDHAQFADESLRTIEYLAPGIMCWAVCMGAVFGAALTFVNWRRNQVLRRLQLAPVNLPTVLSARLAVTMVIAFVQAAIFIGVALLPIFGLRLSAQWLLAVPVLFLGVLAFFAVGTMVGVCCRTEEAAYAASNIIVFPMAFLSGVFIPLHNGPSWLQTVTEVLPMRQMNDALVSVLVRGEGAGALTVPAVLLIATTAVVGLLALRIFRWELR